MSDKIYDQIKDRDYKNVLKYFCELSAVPRGSYNDRKISDYLADFAREQGVEFIQDDALNIIMFKEASPGFENVPPVMIQGHMDMVCVTDGTEHDFENEGLDLFVDGDDLLAARGTTLGGDDGIAVAYGMALIADNETPHPALEIVITTDEETGMEGATALDCSVLKAGYLINCDSEEEGTVLVGCAGGIRADASFAPETTQETGTIIDISVKGLKGGHSGQEIDKGRTNAVLLLTRLLFDLGSELFVEKMSGGEKDNAIPQSAEATILVDSRRAKGMLEEIARLTERYTAELKAGEPGLVIEAVNRGEDTREVLVTEFFEKVLFALVHAPNGVQTMSKNIEGLVESSLNLGIFRLDTSEIHYHYSLRSSVTSYKQHMCDKLGFMFVFLGGEITFSAAYPAWEYRKDSKLRDTFISLYEKEYGRAPKAEAIHAGLECGLIAEKMPKLDIISIGPDMRDIHTPSERLSISSSIRVYRFLEKLLVALKDA